MACALKERQNAMLRTPPTDSQQDYVLYTLLREMGSLDNAVFEILPQADTGAVRALVCTLAGVDDFARVNAHYLRRKDHPTIAQDAFKRCCLACLTHRGTRVLDSEWHAFFECPFTSGARQRFAFSTGVTLLSSEPSQPVDFVPLVSAVFLE